MISQAAIDEGYMAVYFLLTAASAGVFLHAGIKFPWFVFFQKDSGLRPKDAPFNMKLAMIGCAAICIIIGVFPQLGKADNAATNLYLFLYLYTYNGRSNISSFNVLE